jgi:vesicle coat complex subunit
MKALIKRIGRSMWGWLSLVRRPILRRFSSYLRDVHRSNLEPLAQELAATRVQVERLEALLRIALAHSEASRADCADMNLCLDNMVREIARIQLQLEELESERIALIGQCTARMAA